MAKDYPQNATFGPNTSFEWLLIRAAIILLAGLFVFSPAFHALWLWDDDQEVTQNVAITTWSGLGDIWAGNVGADYLPLKSTIQWLEWHMWGVNNEGYHVANITFHLIDCLLLWWLFAKIGIRGAWLAGLLFAVHPIVVESVTWVSEQKNTISLTLLLLAMGAWVDFDRGRRLPTYITVVILFIAALLCKSSVIMFPAVIILYSWWVRGRIGRQDLILSAPFFLISAVFALVTVHFQDLRAIADEVIPVGGPFARIAIAGMAIPFYLYKCIVPTSLLPIYPRWDIPITGMPALAFFLPWPFTIAALAWLFTKRNTVWGRNVVFGLGFFLINAIPILGFRTMSYMRITWVADHLIYLPLIGIIGIVAAGIATLYDRFSTERRSALVVVCSVLFAVMVIDSNAYAGIFVNEDLMWTYNLKYNPDAWQAHSRLAKVKIEQNRFDEAAFHISESHRLRPDLAETNNNMASMLEHKGKVDEALAYLRRAHEIEPRIAIFQLNLASLLYKHGDYEEASENFAQLIKKEPGNPVYLCNYGVCLYFLGRYDDAIASFQKALTINPGLKDAQQNLDAALKKKDGVSPNPGGASGTGSGYNFQLISRPPSL